MPAMKKILHPDLAKSYHRIPFKITKTNHLLVNAEINGVKGKFILDTGASNSCVDFENITHFNLISSESKTKAAGAGAIGMRTELSMANTLKMSRFTTTDFHLVIFDLSHVNLALTQHKAKPVQGIIGADVLIPSSAIIDYSTNSLFLKK